MNEISRRTFLGTVGACAAAMADASGNAASARPNIVYILADDMGYGDVSCLNPESKIATLMIDRLAREGIAFTDAHSPSAVCTPTRYGVITGRYPWRSKLKSGVTLGFSPALIDSNRLTVASLLKTNGYRTGCVGKWHLGLDWAFKNDRKEIDYTKPIANGPRALGFDYFYGISASLDMPPFIYIENDRTVGVPTVEKTWLRTGAAGKDFEAVDVLPTLTKKAVAYIDESCSTASGQPFFLYFPLTAPHTPIVPAKEFQGTSGIGDYGDFVRQVDSTVGAILEALDRNGIADNTLLAFTSDNGCSPSAGFPELLAKGHNPSFHFRGHKADIFEGGHRIPFIARWPKRIRAGQTTDEIVCLTDLMATVADLLEVALPDNAGEDSYSIAPVLLGDPYEGPIREATVHASIDGSLSIRQGNWKLELCPGSGGWSEPKRDEAIKQKLPSVQLYDVRDDVGERRNLQGEQPEVVERLTALLTKYIENGRSTPGAVQQNDGATAIWGPIGRAE